MLVTTLLADTLAVLLALGSLTFYIAAFFYPEVHRRSDFVWGGLGLAYALVLWVGAGQITLVLLLGQLVAVVLLLGLGWQTLTVRREKTPVYQQTPITLTPEVVGDWAKSQLNQLRIAPVDTVPVRLDKRASRSPRQDPRRRPAYEYEFVEDGLLDAPEEMPADVPTVPFSGPSSEPELSVPPSVDAEIISVEAPKPKPDEIPEAMVVEPEPKDDIDVDGAQDLGAVQPEPVPESTLEPVPESASEAPVPESTSEAPIPESRSEPAPESVPLVAGDDDEKTEVATAKSSVAQDADDWGDDFFEDGGDDNNWSEVESPSVLAVPVPVASVKDARVSSELKTLSEPSPERGIEEPPEKVPERKTEKKLERAVDKTREKPSLLATPVILAGWVKDVVASFTRPKPSKPMIEIPRREPSRSPAAYATSQSVEGAVERTPERAVERTPERAPERPTADRDIYQNDRAVPVADFDTDDTDDTDWEESNWDD